MGVSFRGRRGMECLVDVGLFLVIVECCRMASPDKVGRGIEDVDVGSFGGCGRG